MVYSITHTTDYQYDDFVSYCHNMSTLKPRNLPGQQLLEFSLNISPRTVDQSDRTDFFGNNVTRFSIQELHNKLQVTTHSVVSRNVDFLSEAVYIPNNYKTLSLSEALFLLKNNDSETLDARQFILESPLIRKAIPEIKEYATISFQPNRSVFDAAVELMGRIFSDFEFDPGFTNVSTPINDVIRNRKGVCQDFAQIAIACARAVGLPARYMSGYIETLPPPGKPKLVGADASHAWFSLYIPGYGWVDFDPTNNQIPANRYITVAWGRDYYDVPPLKGVIFTNGKNTMKVSVDMQPVFYP